MKHGGGQPLPLAPTFFDSAISMSIPVASFWAMV